MSMDCKQAFPTYSMSCSFFLPHTFVRSTSVPVLGCGGGGGGGGGGVALYANKPLFSLERGISLSLRRVRLRQEEKETGEESQVEGGGKETP